jgi:hypothetical protein
MSAPLTDLPASSISASGLVDGLGRRALAFDRETGVMLERLVLRPELAAFESAIRERVDLLAAIDDERFARPGAVQRDRETGELSVVSEFVAGSRLSDIIETAEEGSLIPGVDVALGFFLEALPAISTFHNVTGFAHGLIEPSRMVFTPGAGQIVFLDPSFGSVVERLGLSRSRLWSELGIAAPEAAGPVRLDIQGDIAQLALTALMLIVGRRLRESEYPDALSALVEEVAEVAQIRGSNLFATSLQRLLQRALPLPGRRPYESADELANEIRLLLRREVGAEVCRQALLDFAEQMDTAATAAAASDEYDSPGTAGRRDFGLDDDVLHSVESFEVLDEDEAESGSDTFEEEDADEDEYAEIPLDTDPFSEPQPEATSPASDLPEFEDRSFSDGRPSPDDAMRAEDDASAQESAAFSSEDSASEISASSDGATDTDVSTAEPSAADADTFADDVPQANSRRRKRQNKSARARKDKLRSSARPTAPPPPPPPKPQPQAEARTAGGSGWLVSPDKAAAFAPPVPDVPATPAAAAAPAPAPVPITPAPAPIPVPVPALAPPVARPVVPMPSYGPVHPTVHAPAAPPAPPASITVRPPAPASAGPVRLKSEPPSGYAPPRKNEPAAALPYMHRPPALVVEETQGKFPWKLAAAALVFVAIAVVIGRAYLPSSTEETKPPVVDAATAPPAAPLPIPGPKVETGDITIETQPSGARVMLDGKPVGESPLKLAGVPVGRHVLTFTSSSGEVNRTVKVAAGKTVEVEVSIFSGWLAVFAPVVLDISLNGRTLGTTEQSRLMIPPGRHELTLTNKEFGYKAVQEVTVEPGEVRSLSVDPRGDANFNAIPWAEVWMDGQKLGDTPLANMRVPLGTREFVFKHPQYGERRITAIIRADQPTPVSVDFTRSQ